MNIEDDYLKISQALIAGAPTGWQKAWVVAEVIEDYSKTKYRYLADDGKEGWFKPEIAHLDIVTDSLRNIRTHMLETGQPDWTRCTFSVMPDGNFSFDIEYPD